jgi:8-oxo-dGTP pyrophosphatase MutT (NUDIX family)
VRLVMKWLLTLAYRANRMWCFLMRPLSISVKLMLIQDAQTDAKIVLVQHSYQPGWHIPGGGVKRGETLEQAARREAREELGATLNDLRLQGIYTHFGEYKSDHLAMFVSEAFTFTGRGDAEIERLELFPVRNLPKGLSKSSRRRVEEYLHGQPAVAGVW